MATIAENTNEKFLRTTKVVVNWIKVPSKYSDDGFELKFNYARLTIKEEPAGTILYVSHPDLEGNIRIFKKKRRNTIQTTVKAMKGGLGEPQKYINFKGIDEERNVYDMYDCSDGNYILRPSEKSFEVSRKPDFIVDHLYTVLLGGKNVKAITNNPTEQCYWIIEEHYKPYVYAKLRLVSQEEIPEDMVHFVQMFPGNHSNNYPIPDTVTYWKLKCGNLFYFNRIFKQAMGVKPGDLLDIYVDEREKCIIIETQDKHCSVCGRSYSTRTTKMRKMHFCNSCSEHVDEIREMASNHNGNMAAVKQELMSVLSKINTMV